MFFGNISTKIICLTRQSPRPYQKTVSDEVFMVTLLDSLGKKVSRNTEEELGFAFLCFVCMH